MPVEHNWAELRDCVNDEARAEALARMGVNDVNERDVAGHSLLSIAVATVIAQSLQSHSPGADRADKAALHIGAVAFIHRFGSSLNEHVHLHVCVVDGVFEAVAGEAGAHAQAIAPGVIFHPVGGMEADAVAQVPKRPAP